VRALLACHWHFLSWSALPSRWSEAPFKLRLDCCGGVRRGYGGCITHDGPHDLGPRAPFPLSPAGHRGAILGGA
jgi:hypothetical protein